MLSRRLKKEGNYEIFDDLDKKYGFGEELVDEVLAYIANF